jgi:hypothetical protein
MRKEGGEESSRNGDRSKYEDGLEIKVYMSNIGGGEVSDEEEVGGVVYEEWLGYK